ncbi:MAG: hypothetical protein RDO_0340 [Flavobacteriales endosymbiont of Rhyzopertha dominica]|nr:MAG: 50S ribosomal protein L4 [Candidatus Shikimatogenerans bostrichidophilus]
MKNLIINKIIKKNIENIKKYIKYKNNNHIIYLYVKRYLNNKRLNNSKTKERGEVKGSRRKIQKQKGTGNSRKGDIKNPIFKGGGRIFGPNNNRNYKIKINKKLFLRVKKILLFKKILDKKIYYINSKIFKYKKNKTKYFIEYFKNLNFKIKEYKKYLIITYKVYKRLILSSRNIKNIKINLIKNINIYNILISDYIIIIDKKINNILNILKLK